MVSKQVHQQITGQRRTFSVGWASLLIGTMVLANAATALGDTGCVESAAITIDNRDCGSDSDCDDGNPCTDDLCDGDWTCQYPNDDTNDCDNWDFCDGAEHCNSGVCISPGDPCIGGAECNETCNEADDNCFDSALAHCGDGSAECSDQDTCDGAGNCFANHLPPGTACGDPSDTACDDPDTCDGTGTCLANYAPGGAPCDDGEMCNGVEACDGNGTCVSAAIEDCNDNDVEDPCDIEDGTSLDCNDNTIPDECDIADGTSPDENGNGIPDECELAVYLDIKPGSCRNPVNPRSKGVVPMAVVGGESFDITQIDRDTLTLKRTDGVGGVVTPLSGPPGPGITTGDVATPFTGDLCDCHGLGGDGIDDLLLKFSTRELAGAFELSELPSGASTMLTLSGSLLDGRAFEASDCVVIPGKPARTGRRGSRKPR